MPKFMRETAALIEAFDRYCKENPDGGFITGYTQLDEAIIGFQPGLHFVAGMSNAGKAHSCSALPGALHIAMMMPTVYTSHWMMAQTTFFPYRSYGAASAHQCSSLPWALQGS